ncbi:hypothetical protein [Myxococcus sp. CA040A]|uniref:hypothetical protein n=1 Tax=Myxococcus sp. CA040A TaxID=2741738 RepID=UPI00157A2D68|nr:hypothetical protein [Myxococcus sp. CA040A]NTX08922.1 hypothetical protein [Myxococcus sp. CA040A]
MKACHRPMVLGAIALGGAGLAGRAAHSEPHLTHAIAFAAVAFVLLLGAGLLGVVAFTRSSR